MYPFILKLVEIFKAKNKAYKELKGFVRENSPTTLKKRYVDYYKNNKLFKIEYMNDSPISKDLTEDIVNYLHKELPGYDLEN